jgi:twitching motility two-component system response regulator PilH
MSTVLIVDDVRTDRELLGKLVESTGNQAAFAVNGEDAVLKARSVRPALVLMDVVMPGLDGFGACRRLKKEPETAQIPVVLITAKGSETDQFWGRKQGADDYLIKPYTPEQIKAVIKKFAP